MTRAANAQPADKHHALFQAEQVAIDTSEMKPERDPWAAGTSTQQAISWVMQPTTLASRIVKAVWCSILLGILVQLLIVLATSLSKATILPDTAQKISWSVLVCSALAIGNAVAKARVTLLGLVGLLAAPAALAIAKVVQKSLSQGVSAGASIPGALEMATLKGIEYALFGALIAWASKKEQLRTYLAIGAGLGFAAACYVLIRSKQGNPSIASSALIARGINETVFPIGCAFVLWFTTTAGKWLVPPSRSADATPAPTSSPHPSTSQSP
jgi:hypothetical protein